MKVTRFFSANENLRNNHKYNDHYNTTTTTSLATTIEYGAKTTQQNRSAIGADHRAISTSERTSLGSIGGTAVVDINHSWATKSWDEIIFLGNHPVSLFRLKVIFQTMALNVNDLNVPDAFKNLPSFNGNSHELHGFIKAVNSVSPYLTNAPAHVRPFWFATVRNKITGTASDRLRLYGEPETWESIRTCLLLHFSDHRDTRTLYNQLNLLKHTGDIQSFYDKILELVATLNDKARVEHANNAAARQSTIDRNIAEGLTVFMTGLREPFKTILMSRNPPTLNEAYSIAMQIQPEMNKPNKPYQPDNNYRHNNYNNPKYNTNRFSNTNNYQQRNYSNNQHQNYVPRQFNYTPRPFMNNHSQPRNIPEPMEVDQSTANTRQQNNNAFRGFNNRGYNNGTQVRGNATTNRRNENNSMVVEELFNNENFQQTGNQTPTT